MTPAMAAPLTIVVFSHNDAHQIERCLRACRFATELILLDDFSSDRTIEIAQTLVDTIVQHKLDNFPAQRNYGVALGQQPWVMLVDSDEEITAALRHEIETVLQTPDETVTSFQIWRRPWVLGQPLNQLWQDDRGPKLYRRGAVRFSGLMHEQVHLEGKQQNLQSPLDHYCFQSVGHYAQKTNHYTDLEAREYFERKEPVTKRIMFFACTGMVSQKFLAHRGYRDGMRGLIIALLAGYYRFLVYAKLWELYQQESL